jgi:hypothetical protein
VCVCVYKGYACMYVCMCVCLCVCVPHPLEVLGVQVEYFLVEDGAEQGQSYPPQTLYVCVYVYVLIYICIFIYMLVVGGCGWLRDVGGCRW